MPGSLLCAPTTVGKPGQLRSSSATALSRVAARNALIHKTEKMRTQGGDDSSALKHFPPSWMGTRIVSPRWLLDHLSRATPPEKKWLRFSGQYRAMIHGIVGNHGMFSNIQSVTYRWAWVASGSNPTLTAKRQRT